MPFAFTCPHCGDRIENMDESFAGQAGPCRKCGQMVTWQPHAAAVQRERRTAPVSAGEGVAGPSSAWLLVIGGVVVTAVIFVVLVLLLPRFAPPRLNVRDSRMNLRWLAQSVLMHAESKGVFPGPGSYDEDGKPLLSWRVHMLPYLDRMDLYRQFRFDEPWDSPHNRQLIGETPGVFWTPGAPDRSTGKTCYVAIVDENSMFPRLPAGQPKDAKLRQRGGGMVKADDIPDGASNTILLVEVDPEYAVIWTKPDDLPADPAILRQALGHFRHRGFLAVFADGRPMTVRADIDDETLRRLISRNDGLPVDVDSLDPR